MAQILIKRDVQAVIDTATLLSGELAVALDTGNVYVGTSTGKHLINPAVTDQASKLKTARNIAITGDGAWDTTFDGSADVTGEMTLAATGVTAGEYGNLTVDAKGRLTAARKATAADIEGLGTAAAANVGVAEGEVPVLDKEGKLNSNVIPSLALTDTYVVTDETAMLALLAQQGDIAIRSDEGKTYILVSGDPTVIGNWIWLKTPESPVSSVNGMTGTVVLTKASVGLDLADNTADANKEVLAATKMKTARAVSISGGVIGAAATSFDGTADLEVVVTAVDSAMLTGVIDCGVISDAP